MKLRLRVSDFPTDYDHQEAETISAWILVNVEVNCLRKKDFPMCYARFSMDKMKL